MVPWKGSGRSFSSNLECGECWSILSRQDPLVELLRDAGGGTGCCQSITFPSVTSSPLARDSPIPSLLQPWCPAGFWCFSSRDLRTFLAKGTNPSSWDEENHSYLHSEECHMLHLSSFQNIHIEQCCCYYWSYILLGLSNYLDTCQNYKNRGWKLNQHKATLINLAELPPT